MVVAAGIGGSDMEEEDVLLKVGVGLEAGTSPADGALGAEVAEEKLEVTGGVRVDGFPNVKEVEDAEAVEAVVVAEGFAVVEGAGLADTEVKAVDGKAAAEDWVKDVSPGAFAAPEKPNPKVGAVESAGVEGFVLPSAFAGTPKPVPVKAINH